MSNIWHIGSDLYPGSLASQLKQVATNADSIILMDDNHEAQHYAPIGGCDGCVHDGGQCVTNIFDSVCGRCMRNYIDHYIAAEPKVVK